MDSSDIAVLLFRSDGSVILRDNGTELGAFTGNVQADETTAESARRIINAATNLNIPAGRLLLFRHLPGDSVWYYGAGRIDPSQLAPDTYAIVQNKQDLANHTLPNDLAELLGDYFDGYRNYLFFPDVDPASAQEIYESYLKTALADHKPSRLSRPVALACTGLVASGKSTVTAPLAADIDAATVSSDAIRELFFRRGFNFSGFRPVMNKIIDELAARRYNLFLDFNISPTTKNLDTLLARDYRIFIVHANPPFEYIKHKILSGNMKHELSFFPKDEYVYLSLLQWKDEHITQLLPALKEKYGIWYEVDTSRPDLDDVIKAMQTKLAAKLVE